MMKSPLRLGLTACAPLMLSLSLMPAALADAEGYRAEVLSNLLHRATTTSDGAPIVYPHTEHPEVSTLEIIIPPGAETGWHKHPGPLYTYVTAGEVEVELEDGRKTSFGAGDVIYEVVDSWHNGVNRGSVDARLIVFALGEEGTP
ncbi:MAG: cupin domain-containing protein, partial [Bacteroidales bacterium]|nr:cupin domain-containing protein [Bacteroidales bacterium]